MVSSSRAAKRETRFAPCLTSALDNDVSCRKRKAHSATVDDPGEHCKESRRRRKTRTALCLLLMRQ